MTLQIQRWSGQAGMAERLALWHVREWANVFLGWTEQIAVQEFNAQLENSELPATWLAFKDNQLIGSISALLEDAPELNDISGPWLASFYIVPEHRGQGVAQALMAAATQDVLMNINMGWQYGDAMITIPGYPVKMIPPSGMMQVVAYENINVETLARLKP